MKWFRKSLGRKAVVFGAVCIILAAIGVFQALYYASTEGFITADYIRNLSSIEYFYSLLDKDDIQHVCDNANKFYKAHDDLAEMHSKDPESVNKEYDSLVRDKTYFDLVRDIAEKSAVFGIDNIRIVLIDFKSGVYFTFFNAYDYLNEDPSIYFFKKKVSKPEVEDIYYESRSLNKNGTSYGEVTSAVRRLNTDEEQQLYTYLFLDTDEVLSGFFAGDSIRNTVIGIVIATILVGIIILALMNWAVVEPINELSNVTRTFIGNLAEGVPDESLFSKLKINTGDEIEHLYHSIRAMEEEIYGYMGRLEKATAERERITTELYIAESIQKHMLPSAEPDFTDQPCYDLAASMRPAKEIGGDFYDFFMLSDDKLAFLIADVSGKGVPAALVMAIGKTMLKNYMKETGNIADAFRITNNVLLDNNSESMFITAYAGLLDLRTGELQYVNAGHEDPFIKCADGEFVLRKERHAIVLGAMENMRYKVHTTVLHPGDRIYIYTDGVPEAHNANLQMFGMEGTSDVLNSVKDEKASDVIDAVCKSVEVFAKGAPQFDDMTMLCLDFRQYYTDDMAKDGE